MYWNYRVRKRTLFYGGAGEDGEVEYDIIEAYYDDNDEIEMWADLISPHGASIEDVKADLTMMLLACDRPSVEHDELPGENGGGTEL